MNIDNKAILDAVLETLQNDETLSSYVKKISHGGMGFSRMIFPFVEVRNFDIRPELARAASIHLIYTIEIVAATRSLAPGVAYMGSEKGTKGVNELCDDVCNAIRGKSFNGLLHGAYNITSNPNFRRDNGETLRMGLVTFEARHIARL